MGATVLNRMVRGFRASVTIDGKEQFSQPKFENGRSIELVGNRSATYEELYRTQPWVHAIVNRYARSIARLPLKVFINPDLPSERERQRDGYLYNVLDAPAPRMSQFDWKQTIVSNLMVHGNAVCVKFRGTPGVPPRELLPTSFAYWDIHRRDGFIWYVFTPGGGAPVMVFRPEEVVHLRWWAAGVGLRATSSMEALVTTLQVEDASQRMVIAAFENGMRPQGAMSVDQQLKAETAERLRAQLHATYGGVDNAFKVLLMEGGAKWQDMSTSFVDGELINLRKLTREEVAAVYNIPPPVVGILDRATFSNISEQHLMEYMDSIQPVTTLIEETLDAQLVRGEPLMEGQHAEFDFDAVMAGNPERRIEVLTRASGGPFMTRNEARAKQNLPPIDAPEMNTVLTPVNNTRPAGVDDDGED